jgi:hypothetical protein
LPESEFFMTTHVTATVIGGILRPDELLRLPENTRVNLTIEPFSDPVSARESWESLKEWILGNPLEGLGRRLTRDELHERR